MLGDDIRLLLLTKESDPIFLVLNIITLTLFSLELIVSSICVNGYFGNFFFWLDFISTISIVTDIEPVWNALIGLKDTDKPLDEDSSNQGGQKGARLSSKAGRMARIVRLFRLIRIVRLYKQALQAYENEAMKDKMRIELRKE